jgi:hypothetical protein
MRRSCKNRSSRNEGEFLSYAQRSRTFRSAAIGAGQAAADGQNTHSGSVLSSAAFAAPPSK